MSTRKESSPSMPEQKKPVPNLKSVPETAAQKGKDMNSGGGHSQDADRHRGIAHPKSGK